MRKLLQFVCVAMLVAAIAPAALADTAYPNLVTNGTFQTTANVGTQGWYTLAPGSDQLPGWTIGGAGVDIITTYWQAPPSGGNSVDLNSSASGLTSQAITTDPSALFTVSFYLSLNPAATAPAQVLVTWGSQTFTFTTNPSTNNLGNMEWQLITIANLSTFGNPTTLSFTSLTSGGAGPVIGGISVVDPPVSPFVAAVPEPASMLLFGSGLIGIAGLLRRKMR